MGSSSKKMSLKEFHGQIETKEAVGGVKGLKLKLQNSFKSIGYPWSLWPPLFVKSLERVKLFLIYRN